MSRRHRATKLWGRASLGAVLVLAAFTACLRGAVAPCPPIRTAPTSFSSSVVVTNDTALLAAMRDQTVDGILLDTDISLGADWQSIASPIVIRRNLTLYTSRLVILDLDTVQNALFLADGVVLTLSKLRIHQEGRPSPLEPGVDWIGGTYGSAVLLLVDVKLEEPCCISPSMWNRYARDYFISTTVYSIDTTFVCDKGNNCYEQQATFVQLCSMANSSDSLAQSRPYTVIWSHVVLLCEDSTSDVCMESNSAQYCIAECASAAHARSPVLPPDLGLQPPTVTHVTKSTELTDQEVRTIVVATVVPAGILGCVCIAWMFLWRQRKARRSLDHLPDSSNKPEGLDKFCSLLCPCGPLDDVEAAGAKPVRRPGEFTKSPSSGALSPPLTMPAPVPHQVAQHGLAASSMALGAGSSNVDGTASDHPGHSRSTSSDIPNRIGPRRSGMPRSSCTATPTAAVGSQQRSSRQLPVGFSGDGFDAAAAVASLAASREQRDAGADHELMDLQKRVQQLAEERLIAEDEKLVLGKPIGRGAFGMVFRGLWRNLDVAVKTMLFSQNDGARQENAIVEAALASSVVHPNVVSVYHFDMKPITVTPASGGVADTLHIEYREGQIDWKMYIVQELCQTSLVETLDSWVFHDQATGLPRMDLILSVLLDVACGCAHIHSKNIIWGDLKPGNVLLKMDSSKPHGIIAKITDFGMSTTIDPNLSHISNYNKGTPFYVAPEILLSHQATKTSDVFSFGILIQQMLTRSTPYQRNEAGGIEVNKQFWRPTPGSCPAMTELRRRCLDQNPKNRPSFDEIVKGLQDVYDSYLLCMMPTTATFASMDFEGGHRDMAAAAAAALAGSSGSCQEGHAATSSSSAGHWELRHVGGNGVVAPSSSEVQARMHPHAAAHPQGLASNSVPTRSTSAFVGHDQALGLQSLQSQAPLFANWPMSDGALQGMQLLHMQSVPQCEQAHAHDMSARARYLQEAGHANVPQPDKPPDPPAQSPSREFFPHWSTQF